MDQTSTTKIGLLHNLIHGTMSNVKNSLYVIDETRCEVTQGVNMRNTIIDYKIEQMALSKIYR